MQAVALAEALSAALPSLQQSVELAGDPSAEQPQRLAAANGFAESLGDLWTALEDAGPAVGELLAFLDLTVGCLPDRAAAGDAESAVMVLELLALLQVHLESPEDPEVTAALLELACSEVFDPPLGPEATALWLDLASAAEVESEPEPEPESEPEPEPEPVAGADSDWLTAAEADLESAALGEDAAELLAILSTAIEDSRADLLAHVAALGGAADAPRRSAAAGACGDILGRVAEASAAVGLGAFAEVCAGLADRIAMRPPEDTWPAPLIEDLAALPGRMLRYLGDPLCAVARLGLAGSLMHPDWPQPLDRDGIGPLVAALRQDPLALESETGTARAAELETGDLSLVPADDTDSAVLASFRREGPDLARRLGAVLEGLPSGRVGTEDLRQAQRFAHTLKGSANICGVRAIAVLSHYLEDLLELLIERELAPGRALGQTLVAGADGLAAMLDMLNGLEPPDPEGLRPLVQQVLDWANRLDREGAAALADAEPLSGPEDEDAQAPLPEISGDADAEESYLQVPARAIDDLLRLVGELSLALSQSEDALRHAQRTLREADELDRSNLLQVSELEKLVDFRVPGRDAPQGAADLLDPLELEQYDALHIVTRRINEGVSDARELAQSLDGTIRTLDELAEQQIRLSQEIRQVTMGTRMVAFGSVRSRLERTVRQTCRATGKEAGLDLGGTEVQIDGDVLDRLMPAMMHALRNAIDHGLEPPERREAVGKPRQGRIEIALRQSGNRLELTVGDDGQGLDLERVRAKAIANGLLHPAADPSFQELAMLTLRPGFSTRERATQVSGRGVGMDVVAGIVRTLNGTLTIDAQPGAGYLLRAQIPASLLTVYCLLIQCNDRPIAIPASSVRQAVLSDEGELRDTAQGWRFRYGGDDYPLVHIDSLMGLPTPDMERQRRRPVLLVTCDGGERAVLVDALLDGRELAAKRLGPLVPRVPGLLSASVLGDGRVAPIVDLPAILGSLAGTDLSDLAAQEATERVRLPTVLIVDDSLSMRRVLTQLVADGGFRPLAARDGMEAIRTMAREPVDLLLVDMEMPQMNGLELTAHVRAQPETSTLPIGMITSRSAERHRREALRVGVDRYFVKPYRDDEVLDFIHRTLEQVS